MNTRQNLFFLSLSCMDQFLFTLSATFSRRVDEFLDGELHNISALFFPPSILIDLTYFFSSNFIGSYRVGISRRWKIKLCKIKSSKYMRRQIWIDSTQVDFFSRIYNCTEAPLIKSWNCSELDWTKHRGTSLRKFLILINQNCGVYEARKESCLKVYTFTAERRAVKDFPKN